MGNVICDQSHRRNISPPGCLAVMSMNLPESKVATGFTDESVRRTFSDIDGGSGGTRGILLDASPSRRRRRTGARSRSGRTATVRIQVDSLVNPFFFDVSLVAADPLIGVLDCANALGNGKVGEATLVGAGCKDRGDGRIAVAIQALGPG